LTKRTDRRRRIEETYKLVPTHNSHDTQRPHPKLLGIKRRKPPTRPGITEHHIRVDIRIQIRDALAIPPDRVGEGRDTLRIPAVAAAAVVRGTSLLSVAVDVHVDELASRSLEVEHVEVRYVVAAVGEGTRSAIGAEEAGGELVVALALGLDGVVEVLYVGGDGAGVRRGGEEGEEGWGEEGMHFGGCYAGGWARYRFLGC
jgi:hypothetical protein